MVALSTRSNGGVFSPSCFQPSTLNPQANYSRSVISSGNHQAQIAAARASKLEYNNAVRKSPTGASQPKMIEAAAAATRPML
jgi:hypothetical protein